LPSLDVLRKIEPEESDEEPEPATSAD